MDPGISGTGLTKTDMDCHACSKGFIAELDFSINGEHVIECPRCGHEHCRVINDGMITEDRWSGRNDDGHRRVKARSFWKSDVLPARTTLASLYVRDLWLRRTDGGL